MDSLNVISDINKHITDLNTKLDKNSKATSVAFSYLYGKIEDLDKLKTNSEQISDRMAYFKTAISDTNADLEKLSSYVSTISINNNSFITSSVTSVQDEIKNIKSDISYIMNVLNNIVEVPEGYIVVKKEGYLDSFGTKVKSFFYRLFHIKQIKERIKFLEEEKERKRLEKEEKIKKQKLLEEKKKKESRNKIKELLSK